jgi:hypothetical protein
VKQNKAVLLPVKAREIIKHGGHSMNSPSTGMRSLCNDIVTGRENRRENLRQLKEQAQAIRIHARKFLWDSKKLHEEMGRTLREDLQGGRENLMKNVRSLREDFRVMEKEFKEDLAEAGRIWNEMCESPSHKKAGPNPCTEGRKYD